MDKIRALIVDDEPLARERIVDMLAGDPEVEIIGECGDGLAAVTAVETNKPDLVFLDVQMPELDGFGVLEAIEQPPVIVFVTAFDRYALRAFGVHGVDYIVKPLHSTRSITCSSLSTANASTRRCCAQNVRSSANAPER